MVDLSKDSQRFVSSDRSLPDLEEVQMAAGFALPDGPRPTERAAFAAASYPAFFERRSAFWPAAFFFVVSQGGHHG
tara:strand:- start:41519 stop:41746 length:228 start_codon:yes stop_codon:yes gene_type:complete